MPLRYRPRNDSTLSSLRGANATKQSIINMTNTAFSYKQGSSFLHRCPAWIKIFVIPLISVLFFYLPPAFAVGLIALQTLVSFVLGFTVREQFADLRPVIYYAIFLLGVKLFGSVAVAVSDGNFFWLNFSQFFSFFCDFIKSEKETGVLLIKLFCVMQSAAIVFKTSTSLQIREGLEIIELTIRHLFHLSAKANIADALAVFICFIPQVSKNWQQAKLAWRARGGKSGLKMLIVLLPVFFSVGMKQAYNSARAISVRN